MNNARSQTLQGLAILVITGLALLRLAGAALDAPVLTRMGLMTAIAPLPHPIDAVPHRPGPLGFEVALIRDAVQTTISVPWPSGPHRAVIPWLRAQILCWGRPWEDAPSERCRRLTQVAYCEGHLLEEHAPPARPDSVEVFRLDAGPDEAIQRLRIGIVRCDA